MGTGAVTFSGVRFENPFLLSSGPPTEPKNNILRASAAGWGGVGDAQVSMRKRPGAALHSSRNWELISGKTLEWWVPRIRRIKAEFPNRVLVTSIMAGSGSDKELRNWQTLAPASQDSGAEGLELNFSCPHMDRVSPASPESRALNRPSDGVTRHDGAADTAI